MKTISRASNRWVLLAGVVTFLFAAITVSQHAYAGIADTRHNLGSQGNSIAGRNQVSGADTAEICVFCHTPHHSSTAAGAPPLWNKSLSALPVGGSYTTYTTATSSTIDGEVLGVGSVSIACLSCHDGTQAMDNIINAPGSGGLDTTGGGATGLTYTWSGSTVDTSGRLSSGVALIGIDLTNDHPIGIEYCGGGISGTTGITGCKDQDFKGGSATGLQTDSINGTRVWWVDTGAGGGGTRQKTDIILYTRAFAAGAGPSVECASCHDPHTSVNPTFLRLSNDGSAVCLACHVK